MDTSSFHSHWQTVSCSNGSVVFFCSATIVRFSFCAHFASWEREKRRRGYSKGLITLSQLKIIKCLLAVLRNYEQVPHV